MIEFLAELDRSVFLFLNMTLANPVTDFFMPVVTSDNLLRVVYGFLMALILWRGDARLRWLVLFSALTLVATDQLSSAFLKHLIERPRPCHTMVDINLLVGCGGGFSMPSSHAANAMGQAFLFSWCVPRMKYHLYLLAGVIAISRVFVGVHYPGDVIVGTIVGGACGILLAILFSQFETRVLIKRDAATANTTKDSPTA
jgi:undecaprenyl-diphosphatase